MSFHVPLVWMITAAGRAIPDEASASVTKVYDHHMLIKRHGICWNRKQTHEREASCQEEEWAEITLRFNGGAETGEACTMSQSPPSLVCVCYWARWLHLLHPFVSNPASRSPVSPLLDFLLLLNTISSTQLAAFTFPLVQTYDASPTWQPSASSVPCSFVPHSSFSQAVCQSFLRLRSLTPTHSLRSISASLRHAIAPLS